MIVTLVLHYHNSLLSVTRSLFTLLKSHLTIVRGNYIPQEKQVTRLLNIVRVIACAYIHTRTEQLMRSLDHTHKLVFSSVIALTILLLNLIQLK